MYSWEDKRWREEAERGRLCRCGGSCEWERKWDRGNWLVVMMMVVVVLVVAVVVEAASRSGIRDATVGKVDGRAFQVSGVREGALAIISLCLPSLRR